MPALSKIVRLIAIVVAIVCVLGIGLLVFVIHTAGEVWDGMDDGQYSTGHFPLKDTSTVNLGGRFLQLERFSSHPFLAEYTMVLTVTVNGKVSVADPGSDTGGQSTVNVCENADGDLLVEGNSAIYRIDRDGALQRLDNVGPQKAAQDGSGEIATCLRPLGAFSHDAAGNYGFQPATTK